jgi:hypothetical protein
MPSDAAAKAHGANTRVWRWAGRTMKLRFRLLRCRLACIRAQVHMYRAFAVGGDLHVAEAAVARLRLWPVSVVPLGGGGGVDNGQQHEQHEQPPPHRLPDLPKLTQWAESIRGRAHQWAARCLLAW